MAIPIFEDFLYPFLLQLRDKDISKKEMRDALAEFFHLSEEDLSLKTKGGTTFQFNDRIGWSFQYLRRALMVESAVRGKYHLTQRGRDYLNSHDTLSKKDLMEYPEFAQYAKGHTKKEIQTQQKKVPLSAGSYMMHNDNWQEIVETIKPIINEENSYAMFFNSVVSGFQILGWKKSNGSLVAHPASETKGKEGVIYLCAKKGNLQIPVVPLSDKGEKAADSRYTTLFDVMAKKKCQVGLSFSDSIQLFFSDGTDEGEPICLSTINYNELDIYGNAFCNLFSFQLFDFKKLVDFCIEEREKLLGPSDLYERIVELSEDPQALSLLIKNYLMSEGCDEEKVSNEISQYTFELKIKKNGGKEVVSDKTIHKESSLDNTKFSFDGGKTYYNKRHFVLNVVRRYVSEHPGITLEELEQVFPSKIISKERGVVRPLSLVNNWKKVKPDITKRYFMATNEVVTLADGMEIVVNNQWGSHFPKFLDIAGTLYDVMSDQPYMGKDKWEKEKKPEVNADHGIKISAVSLSKFKTRK